MDCHELEFLAEEYIITIIPRMPLPAFKIIGRRIGPLIVNVPSEVPLWMAIEMKRQQRCTIVAPQWLSVESLTASRQRERSDPNCAEPPHLQYMEIGNLLMRHAASDIDDADEVMMLLKDLWDMRGNKLRKSAQALVRANTPYANVTKVGWAELSLVMRPLLMPMLAEQTKLRAFVRK